MATKKKTRLAGRDAEKGTFIPVAEARRRKKTAVVEHVPIGKRKGGKKKAGKKK
jgi:hypothetical protein